MDDAMKPDKHAERVSDKLLRGYCCSETIMSLALEDLGKENDDLLAAMAGFCGGMGHGEVCGALAAAVAALYVCDAKEAANAWRDEFITWFQERFGALGCRALIGDDKRKQETLCPRLTTETYRQLRNYIA
jgi:C_GCAxxG_C_C family probable redox protein